MREFGVRDSSERGRYSPSAGLSPAFPAPPAAIPCLITPLLTSLNHLPSTLRDVDRRRGRADVEWENVARDDKDGKRCRDFTRRHRLHDQERPGVQSGAMTSYV